MAFNHTFFLLLFFIGKPTSGGSLDGGASSVLLGNIIFFLFHDGRGCLCCLLFSLSFWAFFINFFFVFPGSA